MGAKEDAKKAARQQPHVSAAIWRPLSGRWAGTNRLWISRDEPERSSPSNAGVELSEDGRQLEIDYDWDLKDRLQTAVFSVVLRGDGKAESRWSDTFHTSGQAMKLRGQADNAGVISVRGSYDGQRDEKWGWRIRVDPTGARSILLSMYNVTPEGKEELAVEIVLRRPAIG